MATLSDLSRGVACQPYHCKPPEVPIPRPVRHRPPQAGTCSSHNPAPDSLPRTCVMQSTGEAEVTCPCGQEESPLGASPALGHRHRQPLSCPGSALSRPADLRSEILSDAGVLERLAHQYASLHRRAWKHLRVLPCIISGICGDPTSGW